MNSDDYVEQVQKLTAPTMDMHRALISLSEKAAELDRCNQRVDACTDSSLIAILKAARATEKKNIAMLVEWMRRHDPDLDHALRAALFKAGPIAEEE
ncbi:ferritin family protein [Sapientia aquatica]|uniref:Ferritin n=1 Tax=Sapientia aquatica TaxID=1549640 RepID=A0A4R5W6C5_9BURK|nr:ferritin [Sapientia aquatica]TDK68648.1 ferritin [Sapientia aquatica]